MLRFRHRDVKPTPRAPPTPWFPIEPETERPYGAGRGARNVELGVNGLDHRDSGGDCYVGEEVTILEDGEAAA